MRSGITNEWKIITEESQIAEIERESYNYPVVIFKNSTRCGISQSTLSIFQDDMGKMSTDKISFYLLDIVNNKKLSAMIAMNFSVQHESPQLLVIENGNCVYHKNHWNISFSDLIKFINQPNTNNN